jgi:chemotaxis receptor (MCP) glutamine deamidase CheD
MNSLIIVLLSLFSSIAFGSNRDAPEFPEVFQREYLHTNLEAFNKIQTYGLNTCVALVIYKSDSKEGVLAHIDARTNLGGIDYILKSFNDKSMLNISLYGGIIGERNLVIKIQEFLNSRGLKVSQIKQNKSSNSMMSVMLDLDTGLVSEYIEIYQNTSFPISLAKLNRLKFGQNLFRHELSIGGGDTVSIDPSASSFPF